MDPTKARLAVAIGAVAVAVTATIFVFTRGSEKAPAKPETVTLAVPPQEQAPPDEPLPVGPAAAAAPAALPAAPAGSQRRLSPGEITELLVTARRVENTDPKRSRELLFMTLVGDPENVEALERLSKKLVTDENPRSAADLADRCLRAEPKNVECAALKAKIAADAPAPAAVSQAQACLAQNPDSLDCMYTLADNAVFEGKKDSAALIALSMHRVAPDSAATKFTVGRVRAMAGEYAQALPQFAAACELGNKQACFRADLLRGEGW